MRLWLSAILRSMGDGVMVMDAKGCIRVSNRAAENLTGWSEDEAFGKSLSEVFHLVDAKTRVVLDNHAARAVRLNGPVNLDANAVLITPSGKEIDVEGNVAPIIDDGGILAGTVLTFRQRADSALQPVRDGQPCQRGQRWKIRRPGTQS